MLLFVQAIRKSLDLLGRHRRWRWVILVFLGVIVAAFEAVGAVLIYALIGLIASAGGSVELPLVGDVSARFPEASELSLQLATAGMVAAFFVLRTTVMVGQGYVRARLIENATAELSNHLVRGYLAMPYLFHTQRNSAELIRNAYDAPTRLADSVLKPLLVMLAELLLVVGLAIVLFIVAPAAMMFAAVALGGASFLLLRIIQPRLQRLGRRAQDARRESVKALQQSIGGFRDIRLLGREEAFARLYSRERLRVAHSDYLNKALQELPRGVVETVLVFVIIAVFVFALLAGDDIDAIFSTLGVFAYVGLRLQPSLYQLVANLNELRYGTAVLDDLLEDRRLVDVAMNSRELQQGGASTRPPFRSSIEIRDVSFEYVPGGQPALQEVNLAITRGEFVGICGPTGGGKSTLIDLLVGLLVPTTGEVVADGVPISEDLAWWYTQLGVVSQTVFLIDETLRANIAFGDDVDEVDESRLERCIRRAQLAEVVAALPHGLDTFIGERGVRLSGGQRQRVAIARALYREPPIIVLDEGTSALDSATESALVSAIDELRGTRTLITVAHRISTVQRADRIVVIDAGRITAEGTYQELIKESPLFRSLAR